jgi:hypothetical protein
MMVGEWIIGKEVEVSDRGSNLRYCLGNFLDGPRKTTKTSVSMVGLWAGINSGPSEYEVETLTTQPRSSVS